ncbi:hypothetical protein ACLM5H_18375 [Fredinandcohnia humi]
MRGQTVYYNNQPYTIIHDYKNGMVEIRSVQFIHNVKLVYINELSAA